MGPLWHGPHTMHFLHRLQTHVAGCGNRYQFKPSETNSHIREQSPSKVATLAGKNLLAYAQLTHLRADPHPPFNHLTLEHMSDENTLINPF